MSDRQAEPGSGGPTPILASQDVWGGLTLLVIAGVALWALRDLDGGTLSALGPGGLPRGVAVFIGLTGLVILGSGLAKSGGAVTRLGLRGVFVVLPAIFLFAVTIRPFSFGAFTTPGLGLICAGPLAIFIAGHATPEARSGDLAVLACVLTAFCVILFGDLLGLPIPMFPTSFAAYFSGWPHLTILRGLALLLVVLGLLIFLAGRALRRSGSQAATEGVHR
jgi:hypothetical protein